MLLAIVVVVYAALWTINTRSLPARDHFYRTYFSFPASAPRSFEDWRYYLIWLDCVRAGMPTDRPCPLGSSIPWAYPPAWLILVRTGLSVREAVPAAALLYIGFITTAFCLFAPTSISEAGYQMLFLASPPFVLALERCNMDVLIFILLGLAVAIANRGGALRAIAIIWVAALLKVYPGISLVAFVRKKRDLSVAGLCMVSFLIYLYEIRRQMRLTYVVVPRTEYESFGSPELFLILAHKLQVMGHDVALLRTAVPILTVAFYTVSLLLAARVLIARKININFEPSGGKSEFAFLIAAVVYCFCWGLEMNFNYRYMFVAMTLPQAWIWASGTSWWGWLYRAYLSSALAKAWLTLFQFRHPWLEGAHALLGWILYGILVLTLVLLVSQRALLSPDAKGALRDFEPHGEPVA
jgi:hypothetical protein